MASFQICEKTKNLWKKIKRNGNFAMKKKFIVKESFKNVMQSWEIEKYPHRWMHNYSRNAHQTTENIRQIYCDVRETYFPEFENNYITTSVTDSKEESQILIESSSDRDAISNSSFVPLREMLAKWSIDYRITREAMNVLLKYFHIHFPNAHLPIDARSLIRTPRQTELSGCGNNKYWHYGLKRALNDALLNKQDIHQKTLSLNINIDGLPMFNSSMVSFWPILVGIYEFRNEIRPLIVGIFCGKSESTQIRF